MNSKLLNLRHQFFVLTKPTSSCFIRRLYSTTPANDSNRPEQTKRLLERSPILVLLTQIRSTMRGGPGYTKFGHNSKIKQKRSKYAYFWYCVLGGSFMFAMFFDFESFLFRGREPKQRLEDMQRRFSRQSITKAKEIDDSSLTKSIKSDDTNKEEESAANNENEEVTEASSSHEKKDKQTFRDRKIIQYENRIRQYSTPDKIFRYFATLSVWNEKLQDYEVHMTPEDFVRSLTYGAKQPERLGLDRYNRFDPQMQKLESTIGEDSIFRLLNKHGIISFTDYIFLLTLLSTPTRHFEIAFHMFDLDGSGNIDMNEFEDLQAIIRTQTSTGQRHRDTHMTGSVIRENRQLNEYFFGAALDQLLTVDRFVAFQRRLQAEVIAMEFELCPLRRRDADGERVMSELTFCEMILAYAGFGPAKTKKMLKNVSSLFECEHSKGISLRDYENFFQVLRSISDIDTALKFYSIAGASIDRSILKHVSKTVAGVDLSDHVIEVIFKLFDLNGDGKLSHKEFVKVMKKRWMRGLQQPRDTGFIKFVQAVGSCTREMIL